MRMGKNLMARLADHEKIIIRAARHHEFCFDCDIMQIALGRMGYGEKRLNDFRVAFEEAYRDYEELRWEDSKCDKEGEYFKAVIDRELARYTGSSFEPYDRRHRMPDE